MLAGMINLLAEENLLEHVLPKNLSDSALFEVRGAWAELAGKHGQVFLTNQIAMMLLAALCMLLVFPWLASRAKKSPVPTGVHNLMESILSFLRTEVFRPTLGDNADRFTPFLWTLFFFVLFCNLLGMLPIGQVILLVQHLIGVKEGTWHWSNFGGTVTGNIMVTGALALVTFITVHLSGVIQQVRVQMDPSLAPHHTGKDHTQFHGHGQHHGLEGYGDEADVKIDQYAGDGIDHAHGFHNAPNGKPFFVAIPAGCLHYLKALVPPVPIYIWPLMFALELIGTAIKPFSLTVRLFANMLAGHLVLAALLGLVFLTKLLALQVTIGVTSVLACAAISCLELFVAFLQAYIFTFLSMLFIASAVAPEH
jgi:F-type H+-transporting ATPase subunit a